MELLETIYANSYSDGEKIVHLTESDCENNASEGAEIIPVNCIDAKGAVFVYFESDTASELAAIIKDEQTYMLMLPVLESIAKSQGYDKVTESTNINNF